MYTSENDIKQLIRLYSPQSGEGLADLLFYRPSIRRQRGSGLGGILGAFARKILPFARNFLFPAAKQYVLPSAVEAVKNVASDVMSGKQSVGSSLKEHAKSAAKGIGTAIVKNQFGRGYSTVRKRKATPKKSKSNKKRKINSKKRGKKPKKRIYKKKKNNIPISIF